MRLFRPQVCVSGLDGPLMSPASDAPSRLVSRLEGVPGAPVRYVQTSDSRRLPPDTSRLPCMSRGWTVALRGAYPDRDHG